ncbi:MAG: glycosyltransferase family 1 protein, partial [Chloroflexi bacterium]|nr:glycosyltransferase family 1 protein [Chloroflexota bacterium]
MTKFWFTSAPLPGHLDWGGLIRTAQALHARGHDVVWVSEAQIGPLVEQQGLPFRAIEHSGWRWPPPPLPTPGTFVNEDMTTQRYRRALDTWLSEDLVQTGVDALLALAADDGAPDAIVTDPFLSAAAFAAEGLDVPLAVGGWPAGPSLDEDGLLYAQRQLGHAAAERIARLSDHFGLAGTNFSSGPTPEVQSPHLHISYFSAYWHQGDPAPLAQTEFVGGSATPPDDDPPAWLTDIPAEQPLGMVTLGSTFTGDLNFFAWGAQAIAANGMIPLVVIGHQPITPEQKVALKAHLPPGSRLINWVPYDHVFPRLRVLVHHGGMGTTHAAILHAIPQIIVPHAADQRGQARRARQAKVGLEMSVAEVRQGQLRPGVQALTTTPLVLEAVASLAAQFAQLGGPDRAANLLAALA